MFVPGPSAHNDAALRDQQIAVFQQFFPDARALDAQRRRFELTLTLRSGQRVGMIVETGGDFPRQPPRFTLNLPVQHPWVGPTGRVEYKRLREWGAQSNLVQVARDIVSAIAGSGTLAPGYKVEPSRGNSVAHDGVGGGGGAAAAAAAAAGVARRPQGPRPSTQLPPIPARVEQLEQLSNRELFALLTDRDKYAAFFHQLEGPVRLQKLRESMAAECEELAQGTLSKEPRLAELRNQINVLRSSQVVDARAQYDAAARQQADLLDQADPGLLVERLTSAIDEVDRKSQECAEAFAGRHGREPPSHQDLSAFMADYRELRELYHLRQAKKQVYCSLHPSSRSFQV